ncbi:MAG: hypothetical protein ABSA64_03040 [Sedimentisphaerales bacterium]|jgi:hypothetical protein
MKWTIEYLEKDGIVRIKTFGPADWDQHRRMSEEALALGRKNGSHRFLADHRKLEHGLSILQVDDIPKMLKEIGVTSEDKVAIVFNPASPINNAVKFFRDAAFLASLQLLIFSNENKAIEWLKAGSPAKSKK